MERQIIIAGTGGQGIKVLGEVVATIAMKNGLWASLHPSYTSRARDGEISSVIKIADKKKYHLVEKADYLIILSEKFPERIALPGIHKKTKVICHKRPQICLQYSQMLQK